MLQGIKLVLQVGTVEVLLTDTLVSGQLYIQPPSQNPILSPPIVTLHFYIPVSGQLLLDTFFVSRGWVSSHLRTSTVVAAHLSTSST